MLPPVANRFIAGESAAAVLEHARQLNERDVGVICNLLGEHYHERAPVARDTAAYERLIEDIGATDLRACVSVKPSQIGLGVSDAAFEENLARIVDSTEEFVWIDMEDHETTDVTLDAYERHAVETDGNVGVCVQANLKRTPDDLERLAELPGKVRLVKGAYDEPEELSRKKKAKVDEAYRECVAYAFREFEGGVAVGSHDPAMIGYAEELHEEHGTDFQVQMLMGVREDAQYDLAEEYEVYQYIPYGSKWMQYFYRRVRERKENALFALRAVLG
jgi:proline dehydrogenase